VKTPRKQTGMWSHLYELASEVRRLAPWKWMTEPDVFGVQDPTGTDQVHFVSIMGSEGIHMAVAAYSGAEALYNIMTIAEEEVDQYPERVLEIPQFQLSFEDRAHVADHAYKTIRSLGLRFRGGWLEGRAQAVSHAGDRKTPGSGAGTRCCPAKKAGAIFCDSGVGFFYDAGNNRRRGYTDDERLCPYGR